MNDIIFVSIEDWDEIWRRNQFFVAEFARRDPARRILFVGLPVNVTHDLRKGRFGALGRALFAGQETTSPPDFPNVHIFHPTKWLPNTLRLGRAFNRWLERRQILQTCHRLGIERPLLWINPQYAVHLIGKLNERGVLYDITDDWTSLATQKEFVRQQVVADDAEMLRRADVVVVCSERLYAMKDSKTKRLHLVMNGVEIERYRLICRQDAEDALFAEAEKALPLPQKAREWKRPVFGYTGTLHPDRVDVHLIAALAQRYPDGTVALIGPSMLTPEEDAVLDSLPNVVRTGGVPYTQLQSWMRAFDVCIVPHKVTPFTESLNPLKLFEYLAAGLPIVSTDVAGFRNYAVSTPGCEGEALVHLARGEEGPERTSAWLAAIARSLAERADPQLAAKLRDARQAEAATASWSARVDEIEAIIDRLPVVASDRKGSSS